MLRVQEVERTSDLARHRDAWNAVVAGSARSDLFQTYEWLTTWLESFWKDKPIAFLLVQRDHALVGLAPLLRDEEGVLWCPRSLVSPINPHVPRSDMLFLDGQQQEGLDAVLAHLRSTRRRVKLSFRHVDQASTVLAALPAVLDHQRLATIRWEGSGSPLVNISGDWEGYLKSRSGHFRSELKRKVKKLEQAGAVRWALVTTVEECDRVMEDVLQIERNSWKEKTRSSFTARHELEHFYRELARRCAEAGWLRMHLLHLDSKPVAYIYGAVYKNVYYAIKTSYDEAYGSLSPGAALFDHALHDAFDQGLARFDFLGAEARWKNEMANAVRGHANVCVFSRSQIVCHWCGLYEHGLKPFVKARVPMLVVVTRKLRRSRESDRPRGTDRSS
jgi:CelD/BcsL family acetyltransferase involved in cellulose biosynthesis